MIHVPMILRCCFSSSKFCVTFPAGKDIPSRTGRGYGDFKTAVGEACADALAPVRDEFNRLIADKAYLETVMREGAAEAAYCARKTLSKVQRKLGFVTL